jgi:hypothetical protein
MKYQAPPLIQAIFKGETPEIERLLSAGEDIDQCDSDKRTALMHAAIDGKHDVAVSCLGKEQQWIGKTAADTRRCTSLLKTFT